jgi:hypothetical protein
MDRCLVQNGIVPLGDGSKKIDKGNDEPLLLIREQYGQHCEAGPKLGK